MKNFNTFVLNFLNEADKEKIIVDNNGVIQDKVNETEFTNWLKKNLSKVKLVKNKKTGYEELQYNGKYINPKNVEYGIVSIYNKLKSPSSKDFFEKDENGNIKPIDKEKFELLGKTIGYRSALAIMKNGDDFRSAVKDVMSDESNMSIKNLENVFEYFSLAGAIKTIYNEKNHEKDNKETVKSLNEVLKQLSSTNTRDKAIDMIKHRFGNEYDKNVAIYKNSFDNGLKDIRTAMAKPDFEWKDPATGLPPKGFKGNAAKFLSKTFAQIGSLAENLAKKIPSQHNIENDLARLLVFGVKSLTKGVSFIANLIRGISDAQQMRKIWSKKKLSDVEDEIDKFLKEFNDWKKKKENSKQEQPKPEENKDNGSSEQPGATLNASLQQIFKNILLTEDEDNERKELLKKFNELMYSHVLPYYCYKLSNVVYSFEHKDGLYIIEYADDVWSTNNTANGKITYIEDNGKLIIKYYTMIKNKLKVVLDEFKDDSSKDAFRGWTKLKYDSSIQGEFEKFLKQFNPELPLKGFLEIYNADVIVNGDFKTYKDYMGYIDKSYKRIVKCANIKPLNKTELKLAEGVKIDSLKTSIKGILIPANKPLSENDFDEILDSMTLIDENSAKYKFNDEEYTITTDVEKSRQTIITDRFYNTYEGNNKLYSNWIKNNKEGKEDIIMFLNKFFGIKEDENKEELVPADFDEMQNDVDKLEKIFNNTDIFVSENFEKTYENMKKEFDSLDNDIKQYCGDDKNKNDKYNKGKNLIAKYKDDLLPQLWFAIRFLDSETAPKNESYNPFIDYSLLSLLEEEEPKNNEDKGDPEKTEEQQTKEDERLKSYVESLYKKIKDLLNAKDFTGPYEKWKNGVNTLYGKLKDKIKDNNYTDPIQQISAICLYVKNKS